MSQTKEDGSNGPPIMTQKSDPESIKLKVELEGVTARNLIKFNVPIEEAPMIKLLSPMSSPNVGVANRPSCPLSTCNSNQDGRPSQLSDSNTIGKTAHVSKSIQHDYRARYWAQMLDTLRRTIDEIYTACDDDESEMECREVILILEHSKKDFYSLIEKMNVLKNFEALTEDERPPFVAWEERKTSPGKPIMKQLLERRCSKLINPPDRTPAAEETKSATPSQEDSNSEQKTEPEVEKSDHSTWADRVKANVNQLPLLCTKLSSPKRMDQEAPVHEVPKETRIRPPTTESVPPQPSSSTPAHDTITENGSDGWTSVQRTRLKSKSSPRLSTSSSTSHKAINPSNNFRNLSTPHSLTKGSARDRYSLRSSDRSQVGSRAVRTSITNKRPFTTGGKPLSSDKVMFAPTPMGLQLMARRERDLSNLTKVQSKSEGAITWKQSLRERSVAGVVVPPTSAKIAVAAVPDTTAGDEDPTKPSQVQDPGPPNQSPSTDHDSPFQHAAMIQEKISLDNSNSLLSAALPSSILFTSSSADADPLVSTLTTTSSQPNLLRQLSTSSDNEISAEEEEYHKHLQQLDEELADAENTETALTCELDRATAEAEDYRQRIIRDGLDEEESEETDELSPCMEDTAENAPAETYGSVNGEGVSTVTMATNTTPLSTPAPTDKPTPFAMFLSHYSKYKGISWELLEDDDTLISEKVWPPGHGIQMHEKLSSPSRKKVENSIEMLEEKQACAKRRREKLLSGRTEKIHDLTKKVEDVRVHKEHLLEKKRVMMEERLRRAEEKRLAELEKRIRKAHDEKTKGQEIAFIQSLEAAQKQHTILAKHQESDARIAELQEERRRKHEEKATVFKERRRQLKESRQAYMDRLQERYKSRDRDLANKAEDKERSRLAAVKAKEQERESKLAAVNQQRRDEQEKLKTKILKKQEDSGRRHQEQMREISRKAFEMSVLKHTNEESLDAPPIEPYAVKKWCRACGVMIDSEVFLHSHLRGKKHQNSMSLQLKSSTLNTKEAEAFNLEHIVDAPADTLDSKALANKARRKAMKAKSKRIRQRISTKASEFQKQFEKLNLNVAMDPSDRTKYQKFVTECRKLLNPPESGPWSATKVGSLNKCLGEALRSLEKGNEKSVLAFTRVGGMSVLCDIIALTEQSKNLKDPKLPDKSFQVSCQMLDLCFQRCEEAALHAILTTSSLTLVHALHHRLNLLIPDDFTQRTHDDMMHRNNNELPVDEVALALLGTLSCLVECIFPENSRGEMEAKLSQIYQLDPQRAQDVVSYIISIGVLDSLSYYLGEVRGPLKEESRTLAMVHATINLLASLLQLLAKLRLNAPMANKKAGPQTNDSAAPLSKASSINSLHSNGTGQVALVKFGPALPTQQELEHDRVAAAGDSEPVGEVKCHQAVQLSPNEDPTNFLSAVLATELFGMVRLLYSLLLYTARQSACAANSTKKSPSQATSDGGTKLSDSCLRIALVTLHTINSLALLSLPVMQSVLSEEGTSLQIRHILSYLFTYATQHQSSALQDESSLECELLHEAILCVGYFVVLNHDNQCFIQTGQPPTLIQQICQLPFSYFMKPRREILLPTLIACAYPCDSNFHIMQQDISPEMLVEFIKEKQTKQKTPLIEDEKVSFKNTVRFRLENRFPMDMWEKAVSYFSK